MSGNNTIPVEAPAIIAKMPLRTYSRRSPKRRFTFPLRAPKRMSRRTQSLTSVIVSEAERTELEAGSERPAPQLKSDTKREASQVEHGLKRHFEHQMANPSRKRMRPSASAPQITPTELFLEHLGASAMLTRQLEQQGKLKRDELELQDDQSEEAILLSTEEADAVEVNEDEIVVANEDDVMDANEDGGKAYASLQDSASERMELKHEDSESNGEDGDLWFTPSVKPKVKRYTLLSLSPPFDQRSKSNGRFLNSNKSPRPAGFKKLTKVQSRPGPIGYSYLQELAGKPFKVTKPTNDSSFKTLTTRRDGVKMNKDKNDGFTNEEARPSPYRKTDRRVKSTLTELNRLDLTQKGAATQKMDGPTWLRGQKRSNAAKITSLWSNRRYIGPSQFQIESQDPLESFDNNSEIKTELGGRRRWERPLSQIADDTDEKTDLAGYVSDADEPVDLLEFPHEDENEENEDESDEVDLLTIPDTDAPKPDAEYASVGQLPPKRRLGAMNYNGDRLEWRA